MAVVHAGLDDTEEVLAESTVMGFVYVYFSSSPTISVQADNCPGLLSMIRNAP